MDGEVEVEVDVGQEKFCVPRPRAMYLSVRPLGREGRLEIGRVGVDVAAEVVVVERWCRIGGQCGSAKMVGMVRRRRDIMVICIVIGICAGVIRSLKSILLWRGGQGHSNECA